MKDTRQRTPSGLKSLEAADSFRGLKPKRKSPEWPTLPIKESVWPQISYPGVAMLGTSLFNVTSHYSYILGWLYCYLTLNQVLGLLSSAINTPDVAHPHVGHLGQAWWIHFPVSPLFKSTIARRIRARSMNELLDSLSRLSSYPSLLILSCKLRIPNV